MTVDAAVGFATPGQVAPSRIRNWYVESGQYTTPEQYAISVITVLFFALVVVALYGAGRLLKRRYSSDSVRVAQGSVITAVSILLSGFLVVVWGQRRAVVEALGFMALGPEEGVKALVTFVVLAGGYTLTRMTKRSIKYGAGRNAITPHQREVAHHVVQILVLVPVIGFTVALWDVPVRNLFLGAGVLGIVLGFAARKTLSGVLAGFVILFARPFQIGDWIRIGEREGIVTDITIYNTTVRTFDEEHVLVPNDAVTQNEVVNYSRTDRLRLHTDVGVDYDADVGRAAEVAVGVMERVDAVADRPTPDVVRHEFGDSAVVLRLRYWIDTPSVQAKWRAHNAVIEEVKEAFEREDIKIPYPQRELMGREETQGLQVAAAGRQGGDATAIPGDERDGSLGTDRTNGVDGPEVPPAPDGDRRAALEDRDGSPADGGPGEDSTVEESVEEDYADDSHGDAGNSPDGDGSSPGNDVGGDGNSPGNGADGDAPSAEGPSPDADDGGSDPFADVDESITDPPADEDAYR